MAEAAKDVQEGVGARRHQTDGEDGVGKFGSTPPAMVTFPDAARRKENYPPSLKLEVEEVAEGMSPRNMWQVYALGGFMVMRWIWARWRERKDRGGSSEDPSA